MFALHADTLDAPTLVFQEYNENFLSEAKLDETKVNRSDKSKRDNKMSKKRFIAAERGIRAYLEKNIKGVSPTRAAKLSKIVLNLSRKHDFQPGLILSIIKVESNFQPWAVSPMGALGLMQIMPETGAWLAGRCGMKWDGPAMLLDEEINATMGVWYLAYLRDKYSGDLKKMLSAYNRGPAKVDLEVAAGRSMTLEYYEKVRQYLPRLALGVKQGQYTHVD